MLNAESPGSFSPACVGITATPPPPPPAAARRLAQSAPQATLSSVLISFSAVMNNSAAASSASVTSDQLQAALRGIGTARSTALTVANVALLRPQPPPPPPPQVAAAAATYLPVVLARPSERHGHRRGRGRVARRVLPPRVLRRGVARSRGAPKRCHWQAQFVFALAPPLGVVALRRRWRRGRCAGVSQAVCDARRVGRGRVASQDAAQGGRHPRRVQHLTPRLQVKVSPLLRCIMPG